MVELGIVQDYVTTRWERTLFQVIGMRLGGQRLRVAWGCSLSP